MVKPFSWKLGLEGGILSGRETDEASPDIPATDARLEVLSLLNAHMETPKKSHYRQVHCVWGQ